jgi:putative transposase
MSYGCQQVLLKETNVLPILEYLCRESNKVYNSSLYYARQMYFKTQRLVSYSRLCAEMVDPKNKHFMAMYASSAQQTCKSVAEALSSFKEQLKRWRKGQLEQKPQLPHYRKRGLYPVAYPKKWLKLENGKIRVPLGNQVKAWFSMDAFYIPFPTNLRWEDIKEMRIVPRNGVFYLEWVYQTMPEAKVVLDASRVLAVDHGVGNWLTCMTNFGKSFIVDGLKLKSFNQWYNKQVAKLKTGKPQGFWLKQLSSITEKRNRRMRDAVNKAACLVINYCLENRVGKVVFG